MLTGQVAIVTGASRGIGAGILSALAKSGATVLRWIPPRNAITMDYNFVRLNISYDDNMIIDRVSCG